MKIDIKKCVKYPVRFSFFRENELFYKTINGDTFPVPLSDIGKATFNAEEKGIMLMRWMRKWNEQLEKENVVG